MNLQKHRIPERGHPVIKLIFTEAERQRLTIREIAKRSGVGESTISGWKNTYQPMFLDLEAVLQVLGIRFETIVFEHREAVPDPREPLERKIAEAYREGVSMAGIMERFNVSRNTVRRLAVKYGVPVRPRGHQSPAGEYELIAEAYRSGIPVVQITQQFKVSVRKVMRIAQQYGVPTRNKSREKLTSSFPSPGSHEPSEREDSMAS